VITLEALNQAPAADFVAALKDIFEHSPWVPQRVAGARPFASMLALHRALTDALMRAGDAEKLALIRAHPELAGKAAIRGELTQASTGEQQGAGLSACTAEQFAALHSRNAEYNRRFGFPFILAVKGHNPDSVIAAMGARLENDPQSESRTALREICRIAHFRLAALVDEPLGDLIIAMAEDLARFSEDSETLTVSYLSPAHRATAARIRDFMLAAGLDARIDAVGNVVGTLAGDGRVGRSLITGSHYDTVTNGGKFDGRLGVLLPIAVAQDLRRDGRRLPFPLEIIAFSEEEGVRFKSTFLGSRAVAGRFDHEVLDSVDARGITLRDALREAGHDVAAIDALARDPARVLGFVEVHIEQGPVLLDAGRPVGVVTGIAGSLRSLVSITGLAGHAGTVPMTLRHDAAAAAAEIVLEVERRCGAEPGLVGTVGRLEVPGGAVNVIPGRCELSIDIRSGDDARRDAADADIAARMRDIAARRGVDIKQRRVLAAAAVPCTPVLQEAWADSVRRVTGQEALRLPSGAGHDAMMMAELTAMGMLFVRCGNGGISHHPAETMDAADAEIAARVFRDFLDNYEVID
jgi:allantoate deiminase/N-carbamoyl-L-amino-acid hydrolase